MADTLELPNLYTRLRADLAPLEEGFANGVRQAQQFKARFETVLRDLGKTGQSDVIRGVQQEIDSRRGAVEPIEEARQRFRATAGEVDTVNKKTQNWTDTMIRGMFVLKAIHAAVQLSVAAVELWRARQADVGKEFDKATEGYLKFAQAVRSAPLVGEVAYTLANLISGGAADKAQQALKDASEIEKHTSEMVAKHQQASAAVAAEAARARAEALSGDEREIALAALSRDQQIANVQALLKAKLIGADQAKEAIAAEGAKFQSTFNEIQQRSRDAAQKVIDDQTAQWRKAREEVEKGIGGAQHDLTIAGMTDAQKKIFDFKQQFPQANAEQVERYKGIVDQLEKVKAAQKEAGDVEQWKKSLEGPAEKYDDIIAKLEKWRRDHKITQEEFEKGMNKAKTDLQEASPQQNQRQLNQEPRFASLIRAGSAEMIRLQFANSQGSRQDEIPAKQLAKAEQQRQLQQQIRDRLTNFKIVNIA